MITKDKKKLIASILLIIFSFLLLQFLLKKFIVAGHDFTNVYWYKDIAEKISQKGIFNVWTPYPQLFSVLIYLIFSDTAKYYVMVWSVLNVSLLLGISCLIYLMLKDIVGRLLSIISALSYLLINFTWTSKIAIGMFIDQVEYFVIFIVLFALYLLLKKKVWIAAVLCAIGTLIKIFPVMLIFLAFLFLNKKDFTRFVLIFFVVAIAILLPFYVSNQEIFMSWFNFSSHRQAWESIYSYPNFNFPPIVSVEELSNPVTSSSNIGILQYLQLLILFFYTILIKKRSISKKNLPEIYLVLLNLFFIFLIFSKGFSSYFIFWFFPLLFLVYKPSYAFLIAAIFLLIGNLQFTGFLWGSVLLRYYFIIVLLILNITRLQKIKKMNFLFYRLTFRSKTINQFF